MLRVDPKLDGVRHAHGQIWQGQWPIGMNGKMGAKKERYRT